MTTYLSSDKQKASKKNVGNYFCMLKIIIFDTQNTTDYISF